MGERGIHGSEVVTTKMRLQPVLLGLLLLLCAGWYAVPVADSDFWWHIAAGRDILQHGLPSSDPFGVFPAADPIRNDTVLRGQWLGQVVLYAVYAAGGIDAVVAFRVAVLLTCLGLVAVRARLIGAGRPLALWPVLALVALGAWGFGGERPQLLSFLFAALFFLCVDLARQRRDARWLWALPFITVLWANSHGGVILGVVLLGLWSLAGWLERGADRRENLRWLAMSGAVFLASLLTPNGIQTYRYLFQLEGSVLQQRTSEYISALQIFDLGFVWPQVWVYAYFLLGLLALAGLARAGRWRELMVTGFLAAISVSSYRYFAFFLFIAAPWLVLGLARLLPLGWDLRLPPRRVQQAVAAGLVLLLATGLARGSLFRGGFHAAAYPVAIADFIERNQLTGRAFNNLEWGGYLLWRLGDRVTPYIDGRMLDMDRFPPYTHMLWATPQGIRLFNADNFQLVILPHHGRFDPQRYKLIDYLLTHPEWQRVYRDAQGVVFLHRPARDLFGGRR